MQGDHTPVYHTVHDNFYWMQHFGDPGFSRHLASGLVWAKTGILLATTPLLPYDPRDYAIALNRIYNGLVQQTQWCCNSRTSLWVRELLVCKKNLQLLSLLPSSLPSSLFPLPSLFPLSSLPPSLPPSFLPPPSSPLILPSRLSFLLSG